MNVWKPVALVAVVGLCLSVTVQVATAAAGAKGSDSNVATGGCGGQVNMNNALNSLLAAKDSLAKAEHDKGGWRAAAQTATNNAISETQRGCAFANTH